MPLETQNPFLQGLSAFQQTSQAMQQAQAAQMQQQAMQRKQMMQGDLYQFSQLPTRTKDDYEKMMNAYPELTQDMQAGLERMNTQQKENKVNELVNLYGALQNKNYDAAKTYTDKLATAYRNSGDEAEAKGLEFLKQGIDTDPEGALNTARLYLYKLRPDMMMAMERTAAGGKSGKTPEQIDRELALQERGMNIREEELATRKDEFKQKFGRFQPGVEKRYNDISDSLSEIQRNIGQYESLAVDMENLAASGTKGGVIQSIGEYIKGVVGSTDETTLLLAKARGIRASSAMKNLPPGAASDTDIKLALSGSPPQNASPQTYASWLRGITKMMKIDAAYKDEQLKYLENSEDGSIRGFNAYWQENKEQIIKNAIGEPITSPTTKGKVSQSEFQKNLNQAGAALQNKAENLSQKSSAELFNMFQKTMRQ